MVSVFFLDFCFPALNKGNMRTKRNIWADFIFLVLWMLLAFKASTIGSDTDAYIDLFEASSRWSNQHHDNFWGIIGEHDTRYETGYVIFNRVLALFTNNPQWVFILTGAFFIYVCRKFIYEESGDVFFSIFLYISLRLFYFDMSGLRQAIAIFICILAYKYIKKRKLVPFILLVLLAMQFHITAVIFLIAYPMSFLKFNFKNILIVTLGGIVAFLSFDIILTKVLGYVPEYYSHYTTSVRFESGKAGNIIVCIIQMLFLLISVFSNYGKDKIINEAQNNKRNFDDPSMMKFMILISVILSVVSLRATTLDRLYYYFWFFSIIAIPKIVNGIKDERLFIKVSIMIFTFLYNVTLLYYRPEWSSITPYKFFWQ